MRHTFAALTAAVALCGGCYTVDIAGQSNFNGCAPSPVLTAGQGISDFRQRIPRQLSVAPADTTLNVVITFTSAVVQADRDRIATYGGLNVSSAGSATGLTAQFVAQQLGLYVAADTTGRLSDVAIYDPACAPD